MSEMKESPLSALRKAANLSQEALGKAIADKDTQTQHHQPRISSYEMGTKRVPLPVAKKMMEVLNRHLKREGSRRRAKLVDMIHPRHR
jgi:hypothetical protein